MAGGDRYKGIRFAYSPVSVFGELGGTCDKRHAHGGFNRGGPQSAPLHYPRKFCDRLVDVAVGCARAAGCALRSGDRRLSMPKRTAEDRAGAGVQARGDGHSQLIPEYEYVAYLAVDQANLTALRGRIGDRLEKDEEVHGVYQKRLTATPGRRTRRGSGPGDTDQGLFHRVERRRRWAGVVRRETTQDGQR